MKLPCFCTKEIGKHKKNPRRAIFYVCIILGAFHYFIVISQPNVVKAVISSCTQKSRDTLIIND